jgi:hypothetical protein
LTLRVDFQPGTLSLDLSPFRRERRLLLNWWISYRHIMPLLEDKLLETLVGLEEIKVVILEAIQELKKKQQEIPPCPTCQSTTKKEKTLRIQKSTSRGT